MHVNAEPRWHHPDCMGGTAHTFEPLQPLILLGILFKIAAPCAAGMFLKRDGWGHDF